MTTPQQPAPPKVHTGIALLSLVTSSMILLNISVFWQDALRSLILLFAVSVDHLVNRHR